ncbi:hypothetical protein B0J17DRAFT_686462 [Rhizoctonia solani]|nr:hypothetical protein B0J17DRAFT_686462 [Rhizoctonia solani]
MDSDEELLETFMGDVPREHEHKRARTVGANGYEDIARELEEDMFEHEVRHEADGDTTQDEEDPAAWLWNQYGGSETASHTDMKSEQGEEGMDVDLMDPVENAEEKPQDRITSSKEEPRKEKAKYTSSGRLLVPSSKSGRLKLWPGLWRRYGKSWKWKRRRSQWHQRQSKSKSTVSKTSASNSAAGTPQPRSSGSAASALAAATKTAAANKSKKKNEPIKKVKEKEARSRSESRQVETPAPEAILPPKVTIVEPQEELEEDTRLYCICKTRYDEDKVMIACDRCDDWYHPTCVNLPEFDVDLIDQFVCPLCVTKYNVRTTYKTRCAVKGCNKPARAPTSKYCSDMCGIKAATARLQTLRSRGVDLDQLWYAAKEARPPEGVVYIHLPGPAPHPPPPGVNNIGSGATRVLDGRQKADLERLAGLVEQSRKLKSRKAALEQGIQHLKARLRLLNCAGQRNEKTGGEKCGFDARIVMDDEDWAAWLEGVGKWALEEGEGDEAKAKLLATYEKIEGTFCTGKKRCDRHQGWQNLKFADFSAECDSKQLKLEEVNHKHQELQPKITELRNDMVSMARPPSERTIPPHLPEDSTVST